MAEKINLFLRNPIFIFSEKGIAISGTMDYNKQKDSHLSQVF